MISGSVITTPDEVEQLRQLRNAGREWMTVDTTEIDAERQRAWWEVMRAAPVGDFLAMLYRDELGEIAGYGILNRRATVDALWVSLGVHPERRGRGHGTAIYADLRERAVRPLRAEVLKRNAPSLRAALRAGFTIQSETERTVILASPRTQDMSFQWADWERVRG